jgi:hypothetical protein
VFTTPSTAAFEPAVTSSSGLAEAPIGARIDISATPTPTAMAGFLLLPPAQPEVLLSP